MLHEEEEVFRYGDVGILLARAVKNCSAFEKIKFILLRKPYGPR